MSLDSALMSFLERDEPYDTESFGGLDELLLRGREAGATSAPELFFDLVVPHRDKRGAEVDTFLADLVEGTNSDVALLELSARFAHQPVLALQPVKRIFKRFLSLFEDRSNSRLTRIAALKGAYLTGAGHARRIDHRVDQDIGDMRLLPARAARLWHRAGELFLYAKKAPFPTQPH